ncbi:unnamed protein product [Lactuca virosa]|uniref:Uncharacterized protein n=1 Tax=Lactuca virosa TaxID=75947 RepID=A0AAU9MQ68_9ASTR|nr:unnamed protein product [Lactuca virosa]
MAILVPAFSTNLSHVWAILSFMTATAGVAIADVTIDASVTENSISHPSLAGDMQSLCGSGAAIYLIEYGKEVPAVKLSRVCCAKARTSSGTAVYLIEYGKEVLAVTVRYIQKDAEKKKTSFNSRPYFKLFIDWMLDLSTLDPVFEGANFQVLTALATSFHALLPLKVPTFRLFS